MIKSIKVLSFLLLAVGSLLIGDSLLFYAKGFLGQELLRIAWNQTKTNEVDTKAWPWSKTYPVGNLIIPKIDFDKVIIKGSDNGSMVYGSGHFSGTALPGEIGNCVIAGHRDTFFRRLGEIIKGDRIYLEGKNSRGWYEVSDIEICHPEDLHWLEPLSERVLTLITCYPFDFIGFAPKRFIVRAVPI